MNRSFARMVAAAILGLLAAPPANAQSNPIRIGVLGDQSGPYSAIGGPGAVLATKMAVSDFGGSVLGRRIEVVSADMQNKPDLAAVIARKWFETEGVEAVVDLPTSSVALAVNEIGRVKNKFVFVTAASSEDLTGSACAPYTIQMLEDTRALAVGTAKAVVAAGGKTWFFLTPDFAFGHAMEKAGRTAIEAAGGQVLGSVQYPITTTDFASFLVTASSSPAQVIGISGVGGAAISVVKQAVEFGVTNDQRRLAIFLQFITDIDGLGLASSHGLYTTDGFYWDENDKARDWSKRFMAQHGKMPTKVQAYTYAIVLHYLKSIAAADSIEPEKVRAKMGETSLDLFGNAATIRPNGRAVYDLTLYEVKKPAESKYPWDYYKPVRQISAMEAFGPLSDSKCASR